MSPSPSGCVPSHDREENIMPHSLRIGFKIMSIISHHGDNNDVLSDTTKSLSRFNVLPLTNITRVPSFEPLTGFFPAFTSQTSLNVCFF